jgi:hypothetical protein
MQRIMDPPRVSEQGNMPYVSSHPCDMGAGVVCTGEGPISPPANIFKDMLNDPQFKVAV